MGEGKEKRTGGEGRQAHGSGSESKLSGGGQGVLTWTLVAAQVPRSPFGTEALIPQLGELLAPGEGP